jgi:PAS domain S-box-containing protein
MSEIADALKNYTILIAEDSEILNNMLKDVFQESGFAVLQAFDGAESRNVFETETPDVALIDVSMPKVDGIAVLRFIKEVSPRTIVVLMTGMGSEEVAVQALRSGASDYLNKPFTMAEVLGLVMKLIESRRVSEENIRLKRQVRRRERYLAHLTKIINEALITADSMGRIQFVNRAATQLWGYSRAELKDKDIHFLLSPDAAGVSHTNLVRDTIGRGKVEGEFLLRRKDEGIFPGYLSTSVIRDGGHVRGIVAVVADLTQVHDVEHRLRQSEKLASLGRVVEGVAHEVRNCLTSLGGFSRRLQKLNAGDPSSGRYTGIILENVERLEKMVRDIEEYANFARSYSFQLGSVDLPEVIEKARSRVTGQIAQSHSDAVSFKTALAADVPVVPGDGQALEEVFYNLILNAYEAMPEGGELNVTVKDVGPAMSVSIMDTGSGIDDGHLGEIFNPFVTSKTSGAGMGLSKVHLLVEEHRGTVNVSSEPGRGTTVEVLLPVDARS